MQKERGVSRFFMVLAAGVLMVVGVWWLSQSDGAEKEPIPYVNILDAE